MISMGQNFSNLLKRPGIRYLIIGGSVYLFELIVIVIAQRHGYRAYLAITLSFWLGLILSFILQKVVTFQDKRLHHKVLIKQIVSYMILIIFNYGFTLFVTKLLVAHLSLLIIRTISLIMTTAWNYYLYKTHIFKTEEPLVS
jgi:putative flippase GtrA